MSPQMVEALHQISILYALEPEQVFKQIVDAIADIYGGSSSSTMAMVNLVDGPCLKFRVVVNPYRIFRRKSKLDVDQTLCQFALKSNAPLLIQDAALHPEFRHHAVVRLKLRRYLGVPICNPDGATIGTLCFLDDKTDVLLGNDDIQFLSLLAMRVGAELERERLIDARVSEHREHARQLEETAQEKRRFVSMVIHDLRHPLTAMRTHLYLLRTEQNHDEHAANVAALENRVRALASLLDELIEYDQIEAGRPMLKIEKVDLRSVILACVHEIGDVNEYQPIEVIHDIDPNLGTATTDARKLRHIVANLVANALKFTSQGCVVVRACIISSECWRLEVQDTGIGMNETEQRRAFEAYYCGESKEKTGVGLGLAIAHRLSSALGAELSCSSSPGNGATFRVDFPLQINSAESSR